MELLTVAQDVPRDGRGTLVAIGKWDGVHLAHQSIIRSLVAEARANGHLAVVMGFHPLPMTVLRPADAPPVLQTLPDRAEVLASLGVDIYLALPFDARFASLTPEQFVTDVLVAELAARKVMVGFNFTFGRGGTGTAETLGRLCSAHGIPVEVFQPVRLNGENVSSTEVRFYTAEGEMERVSQLLGRPFSITAEVVHGDQRGRLLGYPTANLAIGGERRQLPPYGVYAARATILGTEGGCDPEALPCTVAPRTGPSYGAMLNLGLRPTFAGKDLRCEVHLLDFDGDLYGQELRVQFLHRLRGEQAFGGFEALKAQLAVDEATAREYLNTHG